MVGTNILRFRRFRLVSERKKLQTRSFYSSFDSIAIKICTVIAAMAAGSQLYTTGSQPTTGSRLMQYILISVALAV